MMLAGTPKMLISAKKGRSAISNGNRTLHGVDGRSKLARRYRDLVRQWSAPGDSSHRQALIEQAALLKACTESAIAGMAAGAPLDPELTRSTNALRRLLTQLGLKSHFRHEQGPGQAGSGNPTLAHLAERLRGGAS